MESSVDNSEMESALLHLMTVLGETLARLQAIHAREEFGLCQIVASIKFVNDTVEDWVNSTEEQVPESSEVHVYESDFSEVSKSIDAILGEARMARRTSKPSGSPKEPPSTPRDTISETPCKFKAGDHKKKLERFSQALRIRPKKAVNSIEGIDDSPFSAAQEMLLTWMENKKDGWIDTHAEQICLNTARQTSSCSAKCFLEKSNASKKFLDTLWSIHSIPPDSLTKAQDDNAGGDSNEVGNESDNSNTIGTETEVLTVTQRMQKNLEGLQVHCKLLEEPHPNAKLLHAGGDFPYMMSSMEEKQCQQDIGNHELKESVCHDDCWLPAKACWNLLETQVKGTIMEHETLAVPTFYSDVQQALAATRLMHSIHSNLFHCHIQSLLAESFLKVPSAQPSRRVNYDILSNASVYMCFRLAHSLVCNNGKALLSVARRVVVP